MRDDARLLHLYVEAHDNDAFTSLVHRHLPLVYGTALRRVDHDTHLAEDVAQKVFLALARKAPSLRGHTTLSGWLYVSTHAASAEVVSTEQRRKTRETTAHTMQTLLSEDPSAPDWDRLRPALDELICALPPDDREAVVLRFFQKHTFAEIGHALRVTEEAARKRIDRSLHKLRSALSRRGITSTSTALSLALAENAAAAAPAGLALKLAGAVFTQVAVAGSGLTALAATSAALKSPLGLAALSAVLGISAILWRDHANQSIRTQVAELETQQYSLPSLRVENQRLAQILTEATDLRRAQKELPALQAAAAIPVASPRPPAPVATVTITAQNTILWNGQKIALDEYLRRLRTFREQHPEADATLNIQCDAQTNVTAMAYIMNEARKANLVKMSLANQPKPTANGGWF
ncbi:MAG: sigma-70 family RNA polymerase sigma factor [Undibacterium sp.]|nr:sigma-70 family RNA polymerase sigma factor [Opitutaceae bacterium]